MNEAHPSRLISECIAGNEDAIDFLVRQHETGVFRLALSVLGDPAEASEVTAALHTNPALSCGG